MSHLFAKNRISTSDVERHRLALSNVSGVTLARPWAAYIASNTPSTRVERHRGPPGYSDDPTGCAPQGPTTSRSLTADPERNARQRFLSDRPAGGPSAVIQQPANPGSGGLSCPSLARRRFRARGGSIRIGRWPWGSTALTSVRDASSFQAREPHNRSTLCGTAPPSTAGSRTVTPRQRRGDATVR